MATAVSHQTKEEEEEYQRRDRRKYAYHLVASKNKLPNPEDEEDDELFRHLTSVSLRIPNQALVESAKRNLLHQLASSGGDVSTPAFTEALEQLTQLYNDSSTIMFDARLKPHVSKSKQRNEKPPQLEGMWLSISKPNFSDCLGLNKNREYMYTLGRMSFDMFHPKDLVCSIQGTFNPIHYIRTKDREVIKKDIPESVEKELEHGHHVLRTYNIVTAFTIEPHNPDLGPSSESESSPNAVVDKPIEGLMTTNGYVVPNPDIPNRLSIWWTSGSIEVTDDFPRWRKVFNKTSTIKSTKKPKERKRLFGHKRKEESKSSPAPPSSPEIMEEDGRMSYRFPMAIGGPETVYSDILYLDETLRIDSNRGIIHVATRVPSFEDD